MEGRASMQPVIVIDTREQEPLAFLNLPSRTGGLFTGDYSVAGLEGVFSVERKSIPDLVACSTAERDRFERELHRLRGYRFKRLLIVGSEADVLAGNYRSRANPRSILGSVHAFEVRYDVPVLWIADPEAAALQVERWAYYFASEWVKTARRFLSSSGPKPVGRVPAGTPSDG